MTSRPAAVLLDFSGTLFHIESAADALAHALGPGHAHLAGAVERAGGINGASAPPELPAAFEAAWAARDLSMPAHHDVYAGLSRHAGLGAQDAETFYAYGVSPRAWHPFADTVAVLHRLHAAGVPAALVSNIGWDPRPVLAAHGVAGDLDALVLSYEVGVLKPDPQIFRIACERLAVAPADALMVGDNPDADGGCVALGIAFALVDPDPATRRPDALTAAVAGALG